MLLNRFTTDGWLWHLSIEREEKPRKTRPANMAYVTGGHTLVQLDGSRDSASFEKSMSSLEGAASAAIRAIEADERMTEVPPDIAEPLAWLASLQQARSRTRLGYIAGLAGRSAQNDPHAGTVGELQSALLRTSVMGPLGRWSIRNDDDMPHEDQYDPIAHGLLSMRWDIMRYPTQTLAISDTFAAHFGIRTDLPAHIETDPWRAKHGLTPLHTAAGATIALTPTIALSLHRGTTRRPAAAHAVNMHTIRTARSFIAFPTDMNPDHVIPNWIDWIIEAKKVRAAMPKSL